MSSLGDIEVVGECPLGAKCEYVGEDKKLHRCLWYTMLMGKDPQSEKTIEEWRCALVWLPIVQLENSQMTMGVKESVTSFRNEVVKGNNQFLSALGAAKRLENDSDR